MPLQPLRRGRLDLTVLAVFVVALLIEAGVLWLEFRPLRLFNPDTQHLAVGQRPPTGFSLRHNETGEPVNLIDKRDQVIWLVFWGPWDQGSLRWMPRLNKFYEERLKSDPRCVMLPVLCEFPQRPVGFDSGMLPAQQKFYEDANLTLPVYLDETGDARRSFTVSPEDYPTNVIIDAEGLIQGMWNEYHDGLEKEMLAVLEKCLKAMPAQAP